MGYGNAHVGVVGGILDRGGRGREAGDVGVVGEGGGGVVGGGEVDVGEGPVVGIGYGAGRGGLDVEVVELEVRERGVGVGGDLEGAAGAGGVDVPDVDVGEVGKALLGRDRGGEGDPVGRHGSRVGACG